MKIFKQKEIVTNLLTKYPELRDNDSRLVSNVWVHELKQMKFNHDSIKATVLLSLYATGRLTSSDSITRLRRKLQEENPQLRGAMYNKRRNLVADTQIQLGYNT